MTTQPDPNRYIYNAVPNYSRSIHDTKNKLHDRFVRDLLQDKLNKKFGAAPYEAFAPCYDNIVRLMHRDANVAHTTGRSPVAAAKSVATQVVKDMERFKTYVKPVAPWRMTNEEFAAALAAFEDATH